MITPEYLNKIFSYDSVTGILTRKITRGGKLSGEKVGTVTKFGYKATKLNDQSFQVHRLIWLMHYGVWPTGELDHINLNKTDNRISNLRDVDRTTNEMNKGLRKDNTSGLRGIFWHKKYKKWGAAIQMNKTRIQLGMFIEKRDAIEEYIKTFVDFVKPDNILLSVIEPHKRELEFLMRQERSE